MSVKLMNTVGRSQYGTGEEMHTYDLLFCFVLEKKLVLPLLLKQLPGLRDQAKPKT